MILDENKIKNLKKKKFIKSLFIIISKSGNTLKLYLIIFIKYIKKKFKKYNFNFRKKNNLLFSLSKNLIYFILNIKIILAEGIQFLSEVGIIPAYLMGLNIIN